MGTSPFTPAGVPWRTRSTVRFSDLPVSFEFPDADLCPFFLRRAGRATPGERNKVLGHASSDIGDKDYLSTITLDVQAAFLREEPRTDHITKLRSVSTKRARGLPRALPAKEMASILNDPTAAKLHGDLHQLRERGATENAVNEALRKFRTYLHWLKTRALARFTEEWLDDRYAKIIQTRGRISHDRSSVIDRAQALFRVMPERARLADMIKSNEPRTRAQRLSAVQDLHSLARRNFEVIYRPGEEPVDGLCPVYRCKLPKVKRHRANHIHCCRRKELTTGAARGQSAGSGSVPVQYCFLCFQWFDGGDAWEEHCRGHLASTLPKWCAVRVYCHTVISPGFCPYCMAKDGPASKRMRQWTENCKLMAHIEEEHIKEEHIEEEHIEEEHIEEEHIEEEHVEEEHIEEEHIEEEHIDEGRTRPITCCGTEVEDANSVRHHLSDAHGLWKAEWRMFGRKRGPEKDEKDVDPASTPNSEDVHETIPCKGRKRTKLGDQFIEWSPSPKKQSPDPPPSRQGRVGRMKASDGTEVSRAVAPTGMTFISWPPTAMANSSDPPGGQRRRRYPGEPATATQSSSSHCPDPDWDSPSMTAVDDEEGAPNSQGRLELPSQNGDRSDGVLAGDSMDNARDSTTDPTSVSTPITATGPDMFENLLDPALFSSESPSLQSSSPPSSQGITMRRSDYGDEFDLPSLESLLGRNPTRLSPKPHNTPSHEKSTKSSLQIQGWMEVQGPNGAPILEELPDHGSETGTPLTGKMSEGQLLAMDSTPNQPVRPSNPSLVATESCPVHVEYPSCGPQVPQTPKRRIKRRQTKKKRCERADTREQAEQCRARELKDAETEWTRRGYPRISWQRLDSRLKEHSSTLRGILNGTSPSIYRTELELAVARKDNRKYLGIGNATAGYYGPRGQQIL